MKKILAQLILFLGLLLVFAVPGRAEESHRGFFEADLTGGGKAVFFVQGNHALSVYVFDAVYQHGQLRRWRYRHRRLVSVIKTNTDDTITGSIHDDDPVLFDDDSVTATVAGQTVTATRVKTFGPSDDIPGRFAGTATSAGGSSFDVKIVVDSQNRIFFIAVNGSTVLGGFGTVTLTPPAMAKTIKPNGDDDPPGDDHGQDADDLADLNEDLNDDHPNSTFSLTLLTGEAVTGTLTFGQVHNLGTSSWTASPIPSVRRKSLGESSREHLHPRLRHHGSGAVDRWLHYQWRAEACSYPRTGAFFSGFWRDHAIAKSGPEADERRNGVEVE